MDQNKTHELTLKKLEKIFKSQYDQLCIFAYKYVNDMDRCKDLVQDVFVNVLESKVCFESEDKIEGYFYRAVKNKCIDFKRSKYDKDVEVYSSEDFETLRTENYLLSEAFTTEISNAYERQQKSSNFVERALRSLPTKCAEVMKLSIEDYSNKEIADDMNISLNTVKDHKKVAYKKLRKTLSYLRFK